MTLQPHHPADTQLAHTMGPMAPAGVTQLMAWAQTIGAAQNMATVLLDSAFAPVDYWSRPRGVTAQQMPDPKTRWVNESEQDYQARRQAAVGAVTAAIVKGAELGFAPMAALQSIYVVHGRPGLYAEALAALFRQAGHQYRVDELTDTRCRISAKRGDEDTWSETTFTMDQARKAGYTKNQKYSTDPQAMLYARAVSLMVRRTAPELTSGMQTVEELETAAATATATVVESPITAPAIAAAPAMAGARKRASRPRKAAVAAPVFEEPELEPSTEPSTPTAEPKDLPSLVSLLDFRGIPANDRLSTVQGIIGRPIESASHLTPDEIEFVYDRLAADVLENEPIEPVD